MINTVKASTITFDYIPQIVSKMGCGKMERYLTGRPNSAPITAAIQPGFLVDRFRADLDDCTQYSIRIVVEVFLLAGLAFLDDCFAYDKLPIPKSGIEQVGRSIKKRITLII